MPRRPQKIAPVHPGEILLKEFLNPLGISQYRLAKDTSVPPRRINEIVNGKRAISADTALRLSRSPEWFSSPVLRVDRFIRPRGPASPPRKSSPTLRFRKTPARWRRTRRRGAPPRPSTACIATVTARSTRGTGRCSPASSPITAPSATSAWAKRCSRAGWRRAVSR